MAALADARLILASLRRRPGSGPWSSPTTEPDWDSAVITAIVLGLAPQMFWALRDLASGVPPGALARLAASHDAHAARSSELFAQFGEIVEALDRVGIRPIALKGLHVAGALHPQPGLRPMNDLDLLVDAAEMPRGRAVLERLGYRERHTSPDFGPGITKHTSTFRRPSDGPARPNPFLFTDHDRTVEPHTSLEESWFGLRVDVSDGVARRAVPCELGGHRCRVLVTEDLVLHLCVHLCFHLIMGRPSLLQLTDLLAVVRAASPDWDRVLDRAAEVRAAPYALAGLGLAADLLGAAVPAETLDRLAAGTPRRLRDRVRRLDLEYVLDRMRQRPLRGLVDRVIRGVADRTETARWTRSAGERWQVWRSALRISKTDTMRLWLGHGSGHAHRTGSRGGAFR